VSRPPALLRRLLRWIVPNGSAWDGLLGDLDELHAERAQRSRLAADLWYARQVLSAMINYGPLHFGGGRREGSMGAMERMVRDAGYALRSVRRKPGFAAVVVLTLALGIGANAAVFSVVRSVVIRPLPFPESDRLATLILDMSWAGAGESGPSPPEYVTLEEQLRSWEHFASYRVALATITGDEGPEQISVAPSSWNLFPALGVEAALGRTFTAAEDQPGVEPVALLSHAYWQARYGADPAIVGSSVQLNGIPRTVVGVMPPGFAFPDSDVRFWVPHAFTPEALTQRGNHLLTVVARLAPGVTSASAQTELDAVMARVIADPAFNFHEWHPGQLRSLQTHIVGDVSRTLWIMLAAVGMVLVIACANVANLLLARAEGRAREMALRTALGAGKGRLIAQLLTESLVLTTAGGIAAVALAYVGVGALRAMAPADLPRLEEISVDAGVLLFASVLTVAVALVFGLLPAWHVRRRDLQATLREEGRTTTGGRKRLRLRQLLVVSETALAVVMLVSAGLLLQSFRNLLAVDPGYRTEQLLLARLTIATASYPTDAEVVGFYETILARVAALPGATAVGATTAAPLQSRMGPSNFDVEGWVSPPDGSGPVAVVHVVTPTYFDVMGMPVLEGRGFEPTDRVDAAPVALVSETTARRYWPGRSAIGGRLHLDDPELVFAEVVGIVPDVRHNDLDNEPVNGSMFLAHAQSSVTTQARRTMTLAIRTTADPETIVASLRSTVRSVDPGVPVYDVSTIEQAVAENTAERRFAMLLQVVFALLAMTLAAVGLYGVLSYTVAQRTAEMGVRMALGAERLDVQRMVLGQGMGIVAVAVAIGVAGALAAGRLLETLLFEVSPSDPVVYGAVVVLLLGVAFLACWLPARRASGVDPVVALRAD
jgi:putative ABC transport system permease protein